MGGQERGMREDMIEIHYSYLKLLTHMLNISWGLERDRNSNPPHTHTFGARFCWELVIWDKRPERETDTLMAGGWAQRRTKQ